MSTLRTPPASKLGIDLQAFRTDRPDEWRMDEFTREAESMALRIKELEAALEDCVNDYINFDGEYLTSSIFERAHKLLKEGE